MSIRVSLTTHVGKIRPYPTIGYAVRVVGENDPDDLFENRDSSEPLRIARAWAPTPDAEIGSKLKFKIAPAPEHITNAQRKD